MWWFVHPQRDQARGEKSKTMYPTAQGIHVTEHCSYVTHSCYHPCLLTHFLHAHSSTDVVRPLSFFRGCIGERGIGSSVDREKQYCRAE